MSDSPAVPPPLRGSLIFVIAVVLVDMIGFGIIMPQTMGGALAPNPHCAGSASALFGFIQMSIAAGVGALVGQFHDGTSHSMAIAIGLSGVLALICYHFIVTDKGDLEAQTASA